MGKGFTIKCNECGNENVETTHSIDGVHFECTNFKCNQEMNRELVGFDKKGMNIYEDYIY